MGDVATNPPAAPDLVDPYFLQDDVLARANSVANATIRAARMIVLTQSGSAPLGQSVPVSKTGDLTVHGDVVRVWGTISMPGRRIKIFCRRLEFHPGPDGTCGIDVSGAKAADGTPKMLAADAGADGNARNLTGMPGKAGADGENGQTGLPGGEIRIHCGMLVPLANVWLLAEGGRGGNGADGQQGGAGGHGFSGFGARADTLKAYGGAGGNGGNGGDGGAGGQAGSIWLHVMGVENPDDKIYVRPSVIAGFGGNGGSPGRGGRGGDGGTPAAEASDLTSYLDGADSGGGAICGVPGYSGEGGTNGTAHVGIPVDRVPRWKETQFVKFFWSRVYELDQAWLEATLNIDVQTSRLSPHRGRDGAPLADPNECAHAGKPGHEAPWSQYDISTGRGRLFAGKNGTVRGPNLNRNPKGAGPLPDMGIPDRVKIFTVNTVKLDYAALRGEADAEQLDMLFDYVRSRFLITNVHASSADVAGLQAVLQWLVLVADPVAAAHMVAAASATLNNLRLHLNIFSKGADFAVMGSLDEYKAGLTTMLQLYAPIEATYKQLTSAVRDANDRQQYLKSVLSHQDSLVERLGEMKKSTSRRLKAVLGEIDALEATRSNLSSALAEAFDRLQADVRGAIGLTAADFFSLFNQLSFTNREFSKPAATVVGSGSLAVGGVAAAGSMLLSQAGELVNKAIENVPTDSGESVNKNFVIRRLQFLGKDVKSIADLKQARDGMLATNPMADYRLVATREQVESVCSNFYGKYPSARSISDALDQYIDAVAARNGKVEEYNQLLSSLLYVGAELDKTNEQRETIQGVWQRSANPGLPAMVRVGAALRRHAREQCIEQLYVACRVFTLQTLDPYDVFADVLGTVGSTTQPGEIDSASLNTSLIDLISREFATKQAHRTSRRRFVPAGNHCRLTLTPKKNSLLFKMLRDGKRGTFGILSARPGIPISRNPFADMADVRLTHVRVKAKGLVTGDGVYSIKITHPGIEVFVTEAGREVQLNHNDVTVTCVFDTATGMHTFDGELDPDHQMIGPFCQWILDIPADSNDGLELGGLESIEVEFEGNCRTFANA